MLGRERLGRNIREGEGKEGAGGNVGKEEWMERRERLQRTGGSRGK